MTREQHAHLLATCSGIPNLSGQDLLEGPMQIERIRNTCHVAVHRLHRIEPGEQRRIGLWAARRARDVLIDGIERANRLNQTRTR